MSEHKHECIFCGATESLRVLSDGRLYGAGLDLICEDCFTGHDYGPSFDDLPEAPYDVDRREREAEALHFGGLSALGNALVAADCFDDLPETPAQEKDNG